MTAKKGIDWKKLAAPFGDYKWKVQTANEWGCQCVAYIDARHVQQRLDDVVGPEGWQVEFYEISGLLFARLGICIDGEWVWKSDTGSESNIEKDKGHVSDAYKRAAVHWGIGRPLYDLPIMKTKSTKDKRGKFQPADDSGKQLYGNDQLTAFINGKLKGGNGQPNANKPSRKSTAQPDDSTPDVPESDIKEHPDHGTAAWKKGVGAVFAAGSGKNLSETDVKLYAYEEFCVDSIKQLSIEDLRKLYKMIQRGDAGEGAA